MNRKMNVCLFLIVNAMVVLSLGQIHARQPRLTSAAFDDGTQPAVPPPGVVLIADGTQPAVPPPGRSHIALWDDGTQPAVPPQGVDVIMADGTQPAVPPPGRSRERVGAGTAL